MNLIAKIKTNIGRRILNAKLKKLNRKRAVFNFDNAKNTGIIFNATSEESYTITKEFVKFLETKGLKVERLGFVDNKELRDFYKQTNTAKYFSKKNLNWFGKPKNQYVDEFIEKDFDILIDLSLIDEYPIIYISSLSKAKFKVGRFSGKAEFLDFMIDISENPTHEFLISQIKRYLSQLNKTENK
jgi:hypothetical protein